MSNIDHLNKTKGFRVKVSRSIPKDREGFDGEIRVIVRDGVWLYFKYGNSWYKASSQSTKVSGRGGNTPVLMSGQSGNTATQINSQNNQLEMSNNINLGTNTLSHNGRNKGVGFNRAGDLTLGSAGKVKLDSHTGDFIASKAGTEFSAPDSAFAGMILGYTTVGIDATADSYTLSATMTCLDDAMKVKFVAPPSGVVEIFASIYFDASRRTPVLGLSDQNATAGYQAISFPNATDVTNEHGLASPPASAGDSMLHPHWVVTGLTAGTAYEWWFAAKTSLGIGGVLRWGGTATNEYAPFIMKATALPTAVSDFAVYG